MPLLQKLNAVIEILIRGHPAALKVLTGEIVPPSTEEIAEILGCFKQKNWLEILGTHVDTSSTGAAVEEQIYIMAETFFNIIDAVGGWEHVYKIVHEYQEHNRTYWLIFRDYLVWMDKVAAGRKGHYWQGDILAKKYGYSKDHLTKIRKRVPRDIAKAIVCFDAVSC